MDAYRQTDEYKEYKERRREIKLATDQEKMPEAKKKVIKERQAPVSEVPPDFIVRWTGKQNNKAQYIAVRAQKANGLTVEKVLRMTFIRKDGSSNKYGLADLKYDIQTAYIYLEDPEKKTGKKAGE